MLEAFTSRALTGVPLLIAFPEEPEHSQQKHTCYSGYYDEKDAVSGFC